MKETGYMIMKDGLAWGPGVIDMASVKYDWENPSDGLIFSSRTWVEGYLKILQGSPFKNMVEGAQIVQVEREKVVTIIGVVE